MNKKIHEKCQKISPEDILSGRCIPVWFFTNERIGDFFQKLKDQREIGKIFSIGGGGDFVFSLLSMQSLDKVEKAVMCDIRKAAGVSIDLKLGLFKNLEYEETLDLFLKRKFCHKEKIYNKIRETITPLSRRVFDSVLDECNEDSFLKCLKKSGLWFKYSFSQIKNRSEYLPYISSKRRYDLMRKRLDKALFHSGDFNDNLKLFENNHFDLIYVSNILDSKDYCPEPEKYLRTIKEKLHEGGLLFVVTQHNPKKVTRLAKKHGFRVYEKERHRFNIISSFFGHYSYSFLLFERGN